MRESTWWINSTRSHLHYFCLSSGDVPRSGTEASIEQVEGWLRGCGLGGDVMRDRGVLCEIAGDVVGSGCGWFGG